MNAFQKYKIFNVCEGGERTNANYTTNAVFPDKFKADFWAFYTMQLLHYDSKSGLSTDSGTLKYIYLPL